MKRVLVVSSTFPQFPGDHRGEFILRHWEAEASAGATVRVLAPRTAWCRDPLSGPLEVVRFRYAPRALSSLSGRFGILENVREQPWRALLVPSFGLSQAHALKREIDRFGPDLVAGHMLLPSGWAVASACARRGQPFSLYGHGTDVDLLLRLPALLRRRFARWCARAERVCLPSREKLARFRDAIRPDGALTNLHVETMLHCVASTAGVAGDEPTPEADRKVVLFMGRLIRQKGVDQLLAAVARMNPRPELHVAGDGPERVRVARLAHRLGVEATFHGYVAGARKAALFRRAAVLCVPSRELPGGLSEGAPLVIVEALRHGVPVVVASRVGGVPELCPPGEATLLVPPAEPDALARALREGLRRAARQVPVGVAGAR